MVEKLGKKDNKSAGTAAEVTSSLKASNSDAASANTTNIDAPIVPKSGTDEKDVNVKTSAANTRESSNPDVEYAPNILDDYDSVTYHFRLFMMSPDGIRRRTFDSKGQAERILIAESGANTIGIDDVSITSFPSPSSRNRMGTATGIRFTLSQPLGADLVDKIFAGSKRLGLKQFAKTPFFLELSFRGRSPDRTLGGTTIPGFVQEASIGDDELSNVIWVWPIILKTMNMTVDSGGSMYTITAVAESDLPYSNHISDIEKRVTLKSSIVEDAIRELETQLQAKEKIKVEKNKTQAVEDTYKFYIDASMAESKILDNTETRSGEFNKENPDKAGLVYEPGTSIEKILEDVLSNSEYLQTKARGVKSKDAPTSKASAANPTEQILYRVYTDTQLGEFDKIRNDYARNHRFAIVPYVMTTINTRANRDANVSSQQRYDNIRDKGKLRKAYNYIYTGLNDQVFDFDISLNFSWYAIEKFMVGRDINAIHESTGKEAKVKQEDEDKKASDPKSLSDRLGLDPDSFIGEFVDDTSDFIISDAAIGGLAEGIATGDFDQLSGLGQEFLAANISKGVRMVGSKMDPRKLAQASLLEREQLIEEQTADENATNALAANETYLEGSPGTGQSISGGDIETPGKTLLAQFFEQAAGPPSRDLLNISVRVKGDPYWLSPGPIGRNAKFKTLFDEALAKYGIEINPQDPKGGIQTYQADNLASLNSVEPALSQQYFLFRTFTPLESDGESGLTEGFGDNNVINGIFAARVIEHNFSGGQFTQTIDGWRDTRIDLKNINLGIGAADTRALLEQFSTKSDPFRTGIPSLDNSFDVIAAGGVDLSTDPLAEFKGTGSKSPTNTGPLDFQGRPIVGGDDG